jgi:hypothetical protein
MKDWKTSIFGIYSHLAILLATSKGYIDTDTAAFVSSYYMLCGRSVSDKTKKLIVGENVPVKKKMKSKPHNLTFNTFEALFFFKSDLKKVSLVLFRITKPLT